MSMLIPQVGNRWVDEIRIFSGVPLIEPSQLVTDKALRRLDRARKTIIDDNPVAVGGLDTVGGVSIEVRFLIWL